MSRDFYGNPIRPEHFWMQKVLPLVYDESLSYYEVVDKLVHKINEIGCYTNKLIKNDLAFWIRKQLNEIFKNSYYVSNSEKIVFVLTPVTDIYIDDMYVSAEEKIVFELHYTGEVCDG